MKINISRFAFLLLMSLPTVFGCSPLDKGGLTTEGPEVVEFKALPFPLKNVTLLEGPFKHATELNAKSLLNYEPDRLLAKFRIEAGLEPKAVHYEGWESNTIAGHSLGHYLSACALMYNTTRDSTFLSRVKYIVDELAIVQKADGDGYIGAFENGKKILEEEVGKGNIRSQGFDLNGIWAPFYTIHKLMAGLNDAYELCEIDEALEVNKKFADWIGTVTDELSPKQVQEMLHCEHGGMNEALAELYGLTGKQKYLELSRVFHHKGILDPLASGKDILPGHHANTQIPKAIGTARRYELTGDTIDRKIAEFFWERVVGHHSYVTGGNGNHEYFGPPDTLRNRLSANTTETCNVYNMLKLSRHLFEWTADASIADFYERALFNQILSSQHPDDGRVIYNLSLEMGGYKVYQNPYSFTCCVGTGMENHSKYGRNIFFHTHDALFVTQFIAAELNWDEIGLKVKQMTGFPNEQATTLTFEVENPVLVTIKLRYPHWAKKGFTLKINGKEKKIKGVPGSFISIHNKWKTGDKIEYSLPFSLRLESMPDDSSRIAVMYGPLVLAGQLGAVEDRNAHDPFYVPVIMTENREAKNWLVAVENEINTFRTKEVGYPRQVKFIPFYRTHDYRYSVYFDLFNKESWQKFQDEYQEKLKQKRHLEEITIDFFQPGEMQPERDHHFESELTSIELMQDKKARMVNRGGQMSFTMKVIPNTPVALAVEYWGGYTGGKTFDIMVEGEKIATENISDKEPGEFIDVIYDIPANLIGNRNRIKISFVPHTGHRAGPVFGARTIKN